MTQPDDEPQGRLIIPDLDGIPEDDEAEPRDADTDHFGLEREGEEG